MILEQQQPQIEEGTREKAYTEVAKLLGHHVTPERVRELVDGLNKKFLLHGIKTERSFVETNQAGVEPRTPEGGNVSYWTSGLSVFCHRTTNGITTYDTTLFDYAHTTEQQ